MTDRDGVVLAGGFARRFGDADKTLATLDGEALVSHAVDALRPAVDTVVVSCREAQRAAFAAVLGDVVFQPDPTPDAGPLAGLAAALAAVEADQVALATADMPCVPTGLYDALFDALADSDHDAVLIRDGDVLEAAPGVYRTAALERAVAQRRAAGDPRLRSIFDALDISVWSARRVREQWGDRVLIDVNTPETLSSLQS